MTSDQAEFLFDLVKEHRAAIVAKRSFGVWDGLLLSLSQIDRGGGALLRDRLTVLDYGGDVIEAAIIPPRPTLPGRGSRPFPGRSGTSP